MGTFCILFKKDTMLTLIHKNIPPKILLILFLSGTFILQAALAQEQMRSNSSIGENVEDELTLLQRQARLYRADGLRLQKMGNLNGALGMYQKAAEIDPSYAAVFNDIGVVYEAKGDLDKAETSYLRAIKIDPNFLSVYSNLGALYESRRELEKAAYYWQKRASFGLAHDPWTKRARKHVQDISVALGGPNAASEMELIDLMKEVSSRKSHLQESDKAQAAQYFEKAKRSYKKDDYPSAIKYATSALTLDPDNSEIEAFVSKVQIRALSK